jgi:hypothetical protein
MDLLGHFRQKRRNKKYPHSKRNFKDEKRHAPPVLLGWVHASVMDKFSPPAFDGNS